MKTILSTLVLTLVASSSFASTQIPQDRLSAYAEAANLALSSASGFTCSETNTSNNFTASSVISNAQVGYLSDGAQPVLEFVQEIDGQRFIVSITTSSDMKTITKLTGTHMTMEDVNMGNLENPQIVKQFVEDDLQTCVKSK